MNTQQTQEPPHDFDAEETVIGLALVAPELFGDIESLLTGDDFYLPEHRAVFDALKSIHKRSLPFDDIVIADELRSRGVLKSGDSALQFMSKYASAYERATGKAWRAWVEIVQVKSAMRRIIALTGEAQRRAYGDDAPADIIETVSVEFSKIITRHTTASWETFSSCVHDVYGEIATRESNAKANKPIDGVTFGVLGLDKTLSGVKPGQLVIVAAGTGGGKTALVQQAAMNLVVYSRRQDSACLIFNLEMTAGELTERALSHAAHVDSDAMNRGDLKRQDWDKLQEAAAKIDTDRFCIEDDSLDVRGIIARARSWRSKFKNARGLVVVDFLQRMRISPERGENMAHAIGQVAQRLKDLAKELKVPVVVLSQLNRKSMQEGRAPELHDLKESGDIEQAADVVVFIHCGDPNDKCASSLIVAKHRRGKTGTIQARWMREFYKFTAVAKEFE
jgi:replicative DNA helicase